MNTHWCQASKGRQTFLVDNSDRMDNEQEYREEYRLGVDRREFLVRPTSGASLERGGTFLTDSGSGPSLTIKDPVFTEVFDGKGDSESYYTLTATFTIRLEQSSKSFTAEIYCNSVDLEASLSRCSNRQPRPGDRCV
jgi:hypothetical protein